MKINKLKLKKELSYEILILPALLGYLIFFVYPVLSSFVMSTTNWHIASQDIQFIGFENFIRLFHDEEIITGIRNSILYAIIMTIVQNFLAVPLAVALNANLKSKNLLRMIFFSPAVLSILVVGYLWSYIMSPTDYGLLNQVFSFFGISKVNWLGDQNIALFSVIFTQVWQWTGWAMVIYLANLQSIPIEHHEAASIDGASSWKIFWRITLPQLVPSVTFNSVMSMIGGLKVFDVVYAMTNGGPGHATETITLVLIKRAFTEGEFGYACAFSVVFFTLILIISSIQVKYLQKWEDKVG